MMFEQHVSFLHFQISNYKTSWILVKQLSMSSPLFIIIFTLLSTLIQAQDLGVPTSWRKFNNSRPRNERISIAQSAIDTILPQLDTSNAQFKGIGYWQSGNVFSAMANFDHLAGKKMYQDQVTDGLQTAFNLYKNFDQFQHSALMKCVFASCFRYNDDAMWWATAAYYAYRAYGNKTLLSMAAATWAHVSQYVVTKEDASAGKHPNKQHKISSKCYGKSMAGGVFWRPTVDDMSINSITTGLYVTLSAFLAEATGNATYTNAATLSAQWIQNLQINADGIILDSVSASVCTRSSSTWLFTYNSGKFVEGLPHLLHTDAPDLRREGLSVLKDITGQPIWKNLMTNVSAAAIKSSAWEGKNGIITEGASRSKNNDGVGFKSIFIRGLDEVSARSSDNNKLQILIHSYNDVQYNALLELAANGTSYSSAWGGPPQKFTTWGQLAALDVMVTAINTN
ncbi:hypothetical protein D9757_007144 [Collybiopsis confluens]|uniref:Endo-1,6-alpha-mannosidase n=1 Tax=Collybiopsis confluens TaxID=2823264 RepID=A0A8H5M4B9_9AGAR|nr:hypothetical protein D9757_007144 [Collybiopsis confluens]